MPSAPQTFFADRNEASLGALVLPPMNSRYSEVLAETVADLFKELFSPVVTVVAQVASSDLPIPSLEKKIVAHAVASRRAEFIGGRWCAHRALERIGVPAREILVDKLGGPCWPAGVVGSITHEAGICAAVAASAGCVRYLGIDLMDTTRDVDIVALSSLYTTAEDRLMLAGTTARDQAMACFCVKEAVVKAISARVGRYLDMREIKVSLTAYSFRATLDAVPENISGRWGRSHGLLFAATTTK